MPFLPAIGMVQSKTIAALDAVDPPIWYDSGRQLSACHVTKTLQH